MNQEIKLGGKQFRIGHPVAKYRGSLYSAIAATVALPTKWNDFAPQQTVQELLFSLLSSIESNNPKGWELQIQEIGICLETQMEPMRMGLNTSSEYLRPCEENTELLGLYTHVYTSSCLAVEARDRLEVEDAKKSPNLIYMLDVAGTALGSLAEWVYSLANIYSTNDDGKLLKSAIWRPWSEQKIKELNDGR